MQGHTSHYFDTMTEALLETIIEYEQSSELKENKKSKAILQPTTDQAMLSSLKLDPKYREKGTGRTQIHKFCSKGNLTAVKMMMEQVGSFVDINVTDNGGYTPLHEASLGGHLELLKYLLKHGADPNAKAENKDTPLHDAAENDHLEIVEALLNAGAVPNSRNINGLTPIAVAESIAVRKLLLEAVRSSNFGDGTNEELSLHKLASVGDLEGVKNYFSNDNRTDILDPLTGFTALHEATINGHTSIVQFLLESGFNPNAVSLNGNIPLHDAVKSENYIIIDLLLKFGADRTIKNKEGLTASDFTKNKAVIKLLKETTPSQLPAAGIRSARLSDLSSSIHQPTSMHSVIPLQVSLDAVIAESLKETSSSSSEDELIEPVAVKRGRPKGSSIEKTTPSSSEIISSAFTEKKRRGRPPKYPRTEFNTALLEMNVSESASSEEKVKKRKYTKRINRDNSEPKNLPSRVSRTALSSFEYDPADDERNAAARPQRTGFRTNHDDNIKTNLTGTYEDPSSVVYSVPLTVVHFANEPYEELLIDAQLMQWLRNRHESGETHCNHLSSLCSSLHRRKLSKMEIKHIVKLSKTAPGSYSSGNVPPSLSKTLAAQDSIYLLRKSDITALLNKELRINTDKICFVSLPPLGPITTSEAGSKETNQDIYKIQSSLDEILTQQQSSLPPKLAFKKMYMKKS